MISRFASIGLALGLVAGCATVPPGTVDGRVMDAVSSRADIPALERPMPEGVLDREAAVHLALTSNRSLMADLSAAGLAAADWQTASRPLNPVFELVSLPAEGEPRLLDADLRVSLLGVLATPWRARNAAQAYEQAEMGAVLRSIDFIADVRRAWTAAVVARQRLDLEERIRLAAEAALVIAEEIDAAGNAPRIALEQQRVFASAARLNVLQAEQDVVQAMADLSSLLGQPVSADQLPAYLPQADDAIDAPDPQGLAQTSLALGMARLEVERAARSAGLENWESLLGHAEIGAVGEREGGEWHSGWMVELPLPLFDQGVGRRAAARIRAEAAADRYAGLQAELAIRIDEAVRTRAMSRQRFEEISTVTVPQSERLLDETLLNYNAMQVGPYALLTAFQSSLQAGQAYIDAQAAVEYAEIALMQMRAGGSPAAVMPAAGMALGLSGAEGGH